MRSLRVLMLWIGIAACLTAHARFWWSYCVKEWWRCNVSWSVGEDPP